jgi:branched-subunit amino acid aminotransferase/4-amino-4-deoxychorismate lyase
MLFDCENFKLQLTILKYCIKLKFGVLINSMFSAKPFAHEQEHKAIRCVVTEIQRNHMGATDPRIKSGNYLNNVLALAEATKAGFDEPIMLTIDGKLAECSRSNIWSVLILMKFQFKF